MKIAVIGHGNVGGTIARKWSRVGHHVSIGARDPEDNKAQELSNDYDITIKTISEAVNDAEVILFAAPPEAVNDLLSEFRNSTGKIIIDASNSIRTKPEGFPTAFHAFESGTKASVVKCFNTTGFENMADPQYGDHRLDMFMAGDDEHAKKVAADLAKDCGFETCLNFGGSDKVELLEKFALSWINLAIMQGHGRGIGFKVLRRT
ncbi:MAG: NADPH-dependent F420 reductase [Candidatus Cyclobacteriaceae bacterium M2_1C_046]